LQVRRAVAGLAVIVIAHYTESLYLFVSAMNRHRSRPIVIAKFDPTAKVKGWAEAGQILSDRRAAMGSDSMVMAGDYQVTAELAFYMRGQPVTYCAGSYFSGPVREPYNQYDVWRNRRLDQADLGGRDVLARLLGRLPQRLVTDGGGLGVAQVANFSLSCDHRAIDGAVGATFLQELTALIEAPQRL